MTHDGFRTVAQTSHRDLPLKIAANISTLFRELPLLERFRAAHEAGFAGVELQFPYDEKVEWLARAAEDAALPVILINGPIEPAGYAFGMAGRPEKRDEFRASLRLACDYGSFLHVKFVHLLAGLKSTPREDAASWETYVDNLLYAADVFETHGIVPLIEALNPHDAPDYLVGSLDAAQRVLERCAGRVGLQFDAYHVARAGFDPAGELKRMGAWVRHVQFADVPGRHEPGTGGTSFEAFLGALDAAQYDGWVSAEYVPLGKTVDSLGWMPAWRSRNSGRSL
jgi:hydroxypyruvate isomerase